MKYLGIGFMSALLAILFIVFFALMTGRAEGTGGHGVCSDGVVSIKGTDNLVTYDADSSIITGVCIKAGNTQRHTFFTADVNTGCYDIKGIGTSKITVTRPPRNEGRTCQGLSHIDVLRTTPEPTSTPTPIPTITPTSTTPSTPGATETPTPIPTPTPKLTPTPHPTPQSSATPTVTATPIVSATTTPTPRSTPTSTSGQAGVMIPTSTPIGSGNTPIMEMPSAFPNTGGEGSDGGGIDFGVSLWYFIIVYVAGVLAGTMATLVAGKVR